MRRDPAARSIGAPLSWPKLPSGLPTAQDKELAKLRSAIKDAGKSRIDSDRFDSTKAWAPVAFDRDSPKASSAVGFVAKVDETEGLSSNQQQMLSNIRIIHEYFRLRYAPAEFKKMTLGRSLDELRDNVEAGVRKNPEITLAQYHALLNREFFNKFEDFHVSASFASTRGDLLPFLIVPAGNRFVVTAVEADGGPKDGDEILTWNGKPIGDAVEALRQELGMGDSLTDTMLVCRILTARRGSAAHPQPTEPEATLGIANEAGETGMVKVKWTSIPELTGIDKPDLTPAVASLEVRDVAELVGRESYMFVADQSRIAKEDNGFTMGGRSSFVPELGNVLGTIPDESPFKAYIYELPNGKRAGYVRIPSYSVDEEEQHVTLFNELMKLMQERTDCLVIDQNNNPGGSVLYMYALAQSLATKPLDVPQHHMAITKSDITQSLRTLSALRTIDSDAKAQAALGKTLSGYPVNLELVNNLREHAKAIAQQELAGESLTTGQYVNGIKTVKPADAVYDKPVLLLTNALCFSGGDFFPAMLKDNGRVVIMGTKTAGAGGYVKSERIENDLGLEGFSLTASIADRTAMPSGEPTRDANSVERPIEGAGVTPDVPYEPTIDDHRNGFQGYKAKVNDTLIAMLDGTIRPSARSNTEK